MRILAPGDVALVVGLQGDVDLLVVNAVTPVLMRISQILLVEVEVLPMYFLIITTEKVSVTSPVKVRADV